MREDRIQDRARRIGALAAARAARRIAAEIDVPGVTAIADARGVTLSGRGLLRRVLTDARLRWPGRGMR